MTTVQHASATVAQSGAASFLRAGGLRAADEASRSLRGVRHRGP